MGNTPSRLSTRMSQSALWDHYAGLAMQALLMQRAPADDDERSFRFIANAAYRMADAMMACRTEDDDADAA